MPRVRFGNKLGLMRELLVTEYQEGLDNRLDPGVDALSHLRNSVE